MSSGSNSGGNPLLSAWGKSRLPEDTVFYAIFLDPPSQFPSDHDAVLVLLKELHVSILDSIAAYTDNYIWQHEPFTLSLSVRSPTSPTCKCVSESPSSIEGSRSSGGFAPPHLHGKVKYGDNLEDEWFVVFLMYEISRRNPNVSIRVWDTDGEFLLIEAAFSLPRWINPENSCNRVFIRRGKLHLIPEKRLRYPTMNDALSYLSSEPSCSETLAPSTAQAAIDRRIDVYPERAKENMHRVRCRLPLTVAQVLKHEPQMIALAVEGFYDRDVDSMKFAARMERFLCTVDMVDVSVSMSRAMYAQLVQQGFQAPKCYPMPPVSSSQAFREAELGMKIACGFEMMYQQRKQFELGSEGDGGAQGRISETSCCGIEPMVRGNTWESFYSSLNRKGYFRGLLPGSKEYQRLMDEALYYYRNTGLFSKTRAAIRAPVKRMDEILSWPCDADEFRSVCLPLSDDDSWLYNGEEELSSAMVERQMEMDMYELECQKQHKPKEQKGKFADSSSDIDLGDIAKTMKAFVEKVSSYEGAQVPEKRHSDEVKLNVHRLIKEVQSIQRFDSQEGASSAAGLSEECSSSSDMDFDDSEEEYSDSEPSEQLESDDLFMQSYSDALSDQLEATTMRKSFVRANDHPSSKDNAKGLGSSSEGADADFTPVDMDVNLIQSLLDSFSSQQGLPGPASNLLGLMGLRLPQDSAEKK